MLFLVDYVIIKLISLAFNYAGCAHTHTRAFVMSTKVCYSLLYWLKPPPPPLPQLPAARWRTPINLPRQPQTTNAIGALWHIVWPHWRAPMRQAARVFLAPSIINYLSTTLSSCGAYTLHMQGEYRQIGGLCGPKLSIVPGLSIYTIYILTAPSSIFCYFPVKSGIFRSPTACELDYSIV